MNNITDVTELQLYRKELFDGVNQYKDMLSEVNEWSVKYLDEINVLNKPSTTQILLSSVVLTFPDIISGIHGNYEIVKQPFSLGVDLFCDHRKKKKEKYVSGWKKYQYQLNNMFLFDDSISALDSYI